MKLTKSYIDKAVYSKTNNAKDIRWCSDPVGFGLRIYPTGKKSFVLKYRHNNRSRVLTIGKYGELTLDQARKQAKQYLAQNITGADPLEIRHKERHGKTVKDLCNLFLELHTPKRKNKKSQADDKRRINKHIIPAFGNLKANDIKRADVAALHNRIGKNNGSYEANRTLSLISKMFNLADIWGIVEEGKPNPTQKIERFKEKARDRFVTQEELPALIKAVDNEQNQSARFAIWLYLLTGMRKSELLALKWSDIDLNNAELHLGDTKNSKKHTIPLSPEAVELIRHIPKAKSNPYLLPGKKPGAHIVNIDKAWRRIRKEAGLEDVHIHDLRRTVGSWMAQSGNSLHLIGRVLNHSNVSTTAIYAKFSQENVREALNNHAKKIKEIKLGAGSNHDVQIQIRLNYDLKQQLEKKAKNENTTIEKLVENAINHTYFLS